MTPPPPTSTLFPYTTLFRSQFVEDVAWMPGLGIGYHVGIDGISVLLVLLTAFLIDRKSTRLNSSHLGISYAVFCLKTKNNLDNQNVAKMKGQHEVAEDCRTT